MTTNTAIKVTDESAAASKLIAAIHEYRKVNNGDKAFNDALFELMLQLHDKHSERQKR